MWEGGTGLPAQVRVPGQRLKTEGGERLSGRATKTATKTKTNPKKRHCLEFHQEKLKLAVSSRIRFSRFIFFSFILRF